MQKIGLVEFSTETDSMNAYIAYYTDDVLVTRIDLYDDYEKYDVLNTTHCFSSYYKDTNEYYLGDDAYVQRVLKAINKVAIMPGERKQEIDVIDGAAVITLTKTFEEKNGTATNHYLFKQVLIDGELTKEVYKTPDLTIEFGRVVNSTDLAVKPVNFVIYDSYGVDNLFGHEDNYSSAEYYTEEELRLRYAGKIEHLDSYDMVVADSLWTAVVRLKELIDADTDAIAVDVETTGLGMGMYAPDCITGVVLSFNENQSTYYPFRQEGCDYNLPIWFISVILDAYNKKAVGIKSCTFNGKMEIESFWKEKPSCIKFSEYAMRWKSTLYQNLFDGEEKDYHPTEFEVEYVKNNKYAQQWIKSPETINSGRLMTVSMNDDGFHTSVKIDQRRKKGIHKLKTLSEKITGLFWLELELIFKGEIRFNVLPANIIKMYACPDTMNTIRVCKALLKQIPVTELKVLELENEVTYVKAENEFYGLPMHSKRLNSLIEEDIYIKDILEKRFREIHHTSKNIRSNPVKADIFYNRLKANVLLRTQTGAPSASNAALKAIIEDGTLPKDTLDKKERLTPDIAVFIKEDGGVATWDKLSETEKSIVDNENRMGLKDANRKIRVRRVIDGKKLDLNKYPSLIILEEFNKICKELGALSRLKRKSYHNRFQFYIMSDGADSDRQTSDAHQFSDTMKKCVVADSKYHTLISCDYKQVELRVLAFLANEIMLMELMKDPMVDVHRAFIQMIDGTPMWQIASEVRNLKKRVNFGVVYGISEWGLVKQLHGIRYTNEQLLECARMILDFYNGLPGIKKFKMESEKQVLEKGQVETAFGFIRYFKRVKEEDVTKKEISKALKASNNTRVQGFAATMMKKSECYYRQYILEKGWDELVDCDGVMLPKVRLMLDIHDEILISRHLSVPIEEIIKMCKICQEIPIKGAPPFFASPAFVDCWYDGKNDAYEIPIPFRDKILEEYEKGVTGLITDETYLEDLNRYRDNVLAEWMNSLIEKYKTPEAVAEHAQHPDLTHVLISGYIKYEDNITDHMERIRVSVERYMKGVKIDISNTVDEKDDTDATYLGEEDDLGKYMYFDENGEQVIEYSDEDTQSEFEAEEDDMNTLVDTRPEFAKRMEEEYVLYGLNECMIDITDIYGKEYKEEIHNAIVNIALRNPGTYDLVYIYGKGTARVGYKVGYVPDEFNYAIRKAIIENTEVKIG